MVNKKDSRKFAERRGIHAGRSNAENGHILYSDYKDDG
jgi:hypothetical protein